MQPADAHKDHPFCHWAPHTPFVHQDQLAVALIDRRPIHRYHVLVVPREHDQNFVDLPDELVAHLSWLTKRLSQAVREVCSPDAISHLSDDDLTGLGFNLVGHYEIHIIPRFRGDRVCIDWGREAEPSPGLRLGWAAEVRAACAARQERMDAGARRAPGAPRDRR